MGDTPAAIVDVELPAGSSISDILDEILELTNAPQISHPWVARTAAGTLIDCGVPLSHTQVSQGSVVVLSPERDFTAPVVRDVAEALVEYSSENRTTHLLELITTAGLIGLGILLNSPEAQAVILPARIGIFLGACIALLVWLPPKSTPILRAILPIVLVLGAACATVLVVAGNSELSVHSQTWMCVVGAGTILASTALIHILLRPALLSTATLSTIGCGLLIFAVATMLWKKNLSEDLSGSAATTVAVSLVIMCFSPKIAAQLAGLRVPTLPTAGQDLAVSDVPLPDSAVAITHTKTYFDAQILGFSILCGPLIVLSATPGTWTSTIFSLCIAVACLLHAHRHQSAIPLWSLMVLASLSFVSMAVSINNAHDFSLSAFIMVALVVLALISVALWFSRIPLLEPTTIVWLERLESLCIAASLPLALHLLNVFGILRGFDIGLGG